MTNKPTGWALVHQMVTKRRETLGLNQTALAAAAELSDTKIRQMRDGVPIARIENRRLLESALGWEAGSIQAILDGGEPSLVVDVRTDPREDQLEALFQEVRELLRENGDALREQSIVLQEQAAVLRLVLEAVGRPQP